MSIISYNYLIMHVPMYTESTNKRMNVILKTRIPQYINLLGPKGFYVTDISCACSVKDAACIISFILRLFSS